MKNDLTNKLKNVDGFDTFEDGVEGEKQRASGPIQGTLIKFTNTGEWAFRDDEILPDDLELVAIDIARIVQKWGADHQPLETIYLKNGEKFPDLTRMNDEVPDGPA